jgi:exodeoxyribonuclease-5
MITLNEQQQHAHDILVPYLLGKNKDKWAWVLKGYAGTGKTTTIGTVIKTVMDTSKDNLFGGPTIAVSAPTHKAVQVLKRMRAFDGDVMYSTIHSLLGLKEQIDITTGKQSFVQDFGSKYAPPIEGVNILIIDEVSMLSNELFLKIVSYVKAGLKLVMMGDPVQIPPVNEGDPYPFIPKRVEEYNMGVLELTEIRRQAADNPILGYATSIRQVYKTGDVSPKTQLNGDTGVDVLSGSNQDKLDNLLQKYFNNMEFELDPDHAKVIAWTNATVASMNTRIRTMLYGSGAAKVVVGEKLVCDEPVMRDDSVLLSNNQEIEVVDFTSRTKELEFLTPGQVGQETITVPIQYYRCKVKFLTLDWSGKEMMREEMIDIIHEDDLATFNALQAKHKEVTLACPVKGIKASYWKKYYSNRRKFAWTKYNYAITAHKSQGSTYGSAIVLEWDINKNRNTEERNRIKYVAATRPKNMLHIVV